MLLLTEDKAFAGATHTQVPLCLFVRLFVRLRSAPLLMHNTYIVIKTHAAPEAALCAPLFVRSDSPSKPLELGLEDCERNGSVSEPNAYGDAEVLLGVSS